MNFHSIKISFASLAIAAAVLVGCESDTHKLGINDQFDADSEARPVENIFAQQNAIASREDGQLYASHFSDGELNSLGCQKLDAMLRPSGVSKLNLFLSIPKDATYAPREAAVIAYLADKGLASNSYTLTAGPNPNGGGTTAQGLRGLSTQSGAAAAAPSDSK